MSEPVTIFTGDDVRQQVTLTKDGSTFEIDSSATVEAAFVYGDGRTSATYAVSEATTGSDWSASKIVVSLSSAESALLTAGIATLEVQVDDGGELTWQLPIRIKTGYIE